MYVVDSKEEWQEKYASENEGKSRLLFDVLEDDNKSWGCKMLVMPGGPSDLCGAVTFFRAREGGYAGKELCIEHAIAASGGDKCATEECPYEGNFAHRDYPWDYEVNAPAGDDDDDGLCRHCAAQPRDREP